MDHDVVNNEDVVQELENLKVRIEEEKDQLDVSVPPEIQEKLEKLHQS